MKTNDNKTFKVDLESTDCSIGFIAIRLDDGSTGFTLFRGKKEAICQYVGEESERDNVVFAAAYGEEVESVYDSNTAFIMAKLGKLMHEIIDDHTDSGIIEDMLKSNNIIRN